MKDQIYEHQPSLAKLVDYRTGAIRASIELFVPQHQKMMKLLETN